MSELPTDAIDTAERLTRLARQAVDDDEESAYRGEREELLAEHGFTARVREDDANEVLVCHPADWVVDGVIRPDQIDDIDRGVEVQLSGPGSSSPWEEIEERNRAVAETIRERHGEVHGANAAALADFMGNHYGKPIAKATPDELEEFREDYFRRNAWPSDEQLAQVAQSVRLAVDEAKRQAEESD